MLWQAVEVLHRVSCGLGQGLTNARGMSTLGNQTGRRAFPPGVWEEGWGQVAWLLCVVAALLVITVHHLKPQDTVANTPRFAINGP